MVDPRELGQKLYQTDRLEESIFEDPDLEQALTGRETWPFLPEQRALFTKERLRLGQPVPFDPRMAAVREAQEDKLVLTFDIGGTQASAGLSKGGVLIAETVETRRHQQGKQIPQWLIDKINHARALADISAIGISTAGLLEPSGSYIAAANIPLLLADLKNLTGGLSWAELIKQQLDKEIPVAVFNDVVAGTMAATVAAYESNKELTTLIFVGNGTGLGVTVWTDNLIYPTEAGHVPAVTGLNPYHVRTQCLVGPTDTYVCLENVGARGKIQPIIDQLQQEGRLNCQSLVDLLDHSAYVLAHGIDGVLHYFNLTSLDRTVIAMDGGGMKVPGFVQRVKQILAENYIKEGLLSPGDELSTLTTYKFSVNACLTGAAIGASLVTDKPHFQSPLPPIGKTTLTPESHLYL